MTPKEIKALDYIRERITVAGYSPTLSEIGIEIGVSNAGAMKIANALVEARHIRRIPSKKRGIELLGVTDLRSTDTATMIAELQRRGVEPGAFVADRPRRRSGDVTCAVDCCGETVQRGHMFCREHYWSITEITRQRLFRAHKRFRSSRRREDEREYQAAYQAALLEATA
jgi:hypothetical protein